ncbi:hypothetical protein BMF94_5570 [Rhodotorula taiwanensis]|uniref:Proteophosphoglycan ppg4 n=1 Tax=Rhodotorula taiwanensis TaxID=741276 RepID=A0A2S5B393_9BASI|nr:hypothetical protein BMF94_5570 [Rhodotorula taiwanensis]
MATSPTRSPGAYMPTAGTSSAHRHAAFPTPLDLSLLPGLSLDRLGCAAEEDTCVSNGFESEPLTRTASESLLFGGRSAAPFQPNVIAAKTLVSPPPPAGSSYADSPASRGPFAQPVPPPVTRHSSLPNDLEWGLRRLSLESAVDAKAKRERAAVRDNWEDPALAAARRALWDDDDNDDQAEDHSGGTEVDHSSRTAGSGQGALAVSSSAVTEHGGDSTAPRVSLDTLASAESSADGDESNQDDEEEDGEGRAAYSLLPPPARMPCHATLSPRTSCLRNSPLARSASLALSSSTSSVSSESSPVSCDSDALPTPTNLSSRYGSRRYSSGRLSPSSAVSTASTSAPPSVQFSLAPPLEGATYSAIDYERGGDGPVEKLSVREWIELQGVREAVGVWSGRIEPWSEEAEAAQQRLAATAGGAGTGVKSLSRSSSVSCCTAPAALVGVVQVTKSAHNSPVLGSSPLWR